METSTRSPRPENLLSEAGAAAALDAALAVEEHELGDGDGLLEVALLLDEAGLSRTVDQGLVLQRALAALVADRAVERVVGEQQLKDAVLGLLHLLGLGDDDHAVAHPDEAGRSQGGAPRALDLDQAHATDPDGLHAGVVAEAWDVGPRPLRRGDDHLALARRDLSAIEREADRAVVLLRHGGSRRG